MSYLQASSLHTAISLLSNINALRSESENLHEIPRVDARKTTFDTFFMEYLLPNKPCILVGFNTFFAVAEQMWTSPTTPTKQQDADATGACRVPDLDKLKIYSDMQVTVDDCNKQSGYYQKRDIIRFGEYLTYWKQTLQQTNNDRLLYVKDWHLYRDHSPIPIPGAGPNQSFYKVPSFFTEDWLNEYYDSRPETVDEPRDDYRFVYMGVKGTWTPLHTDVLRSYSWSHNVCGRKLWIIFPPSARKLITNESGVYPVNANDVDEKAFPRFSEARRITCVQEAGETIFIPSGWHHQVHNLEDTISINHNWCNVCNIDLMWEFLLNDFNNIISELSDLADTFASPVEFVDQCMTLLRANAGLSVQDFCAMLDVVLERSLATIRQQDETAAVEFRNIALLNCHRIKILLNDMHGALQALMQQRLLSSHASEHESMVHSLGIDLIVSILDKIPESICE